MADLRLTDEQKQYQKLASDFAQKEIAPQSAHFDQNREFPDNICCKAWELGLLNLHIPDVYGGLGLGTFDACLITEEIAAACTGIGGIFEANNMAQLPLIVFGNDQQKSEFLTPMIEELSFAAICIPDHKISELKYTKSKENGEDYILRGRKTWVTNAAIAKWYFVLAASDDRQGEFTAFIVPRHTDGIVVLEKEITMGQRAKDVREISFEEVCINKKHVLGPVGDGLKIWNETLGYARPLIAAAAVGLARSAMEHSLRYSKERIAFGQPIANHQAVGFMLADMAKDIEAARLMTWQAAYIGDRGENNAMEAAMAKSFAVDMAMRVATDAVQIFGGYGYSREYPVEKLMRDAKVLQVCEGTSQAQRVQIAQQLVGVSQNN